MASAEDIFRLLVIEGDDDRPVVNRAIREGDRSAEVIEAADLAAGLAAVQTTPPDCILAGYYLSDGTAADLLGRLEAIENHPPVIVMTGVDDERTALEALKLGAQDYLLKSQLDGHTLWRAIRYSIERQEVQRLRHRLVETERLSAIGQLAAGVAHEINNPACYILANLGFIRESLAEISGLVGSANSNEALAKLAAGSELREALDEADEALADSIHGTERICKIVRELRPFSQIERGELEPVDFNQVVESAINLTTNEIRHRARLVRELGDVPTLVGDRAKLCQVAVNLIANATQSIESGDADNNAITITTETEGDQVVLKVSDTGSGIREADRARIFEPFFSTRARGVGTGLGLAVCAETVRKHNGTIEVDSAVGVGTTFTVRLPRRGEIERGDRAEPAAVDKLEPGVRVLLVDDDRLVRAGLRRMLAPPHAVIEAESGSAALELLDAEEFDVIICDLMMPELDGPAVYEELSRSRPELLERIVFLTGGAFTPRARAFVGEVGAVVLQKPVSRASLLATVSGVNHS